MPTSKRIAIRMEERLVKVAHLYITGKTQAEIGAQFNVSQVQISKDLATIRKVWRQVMAQAIDDHKAQQLARIDALELTYWDAWERSRAEAVEVTTEKTDGVPSTQPGPDGKPQAVVLGGRTKGRVVKRSRDGEAAFLAGIQWCIAERSKLLGLNAPIKLAQTDPSGEQAYADTLTPSQRFAEVAAILERARLRAGDRPVGGEPIEATYIDLPGPA